MSQIILKVGQTKITSVQIFLSRIFLFDFFHNIPNRYKFAENNPKDMLNYPMSCSCNSSNRQLKKSIYLVTAAILNGVRGCRTQFWKGPLKDHPCQIWFNLVQQFQGRRFKV